MAKSSENQQECDDVMDVIEGLMEQRVNTSKRTPWGWTRCNLKGRAIVVVLVQRDLLFCQSKK
jgi:hypothetical protein